jgi:hypothetical protein
VPDASSQAHQFRIIIYNVLLFLTAVSLLTASSRSPGSPDQTLAPTDASSTELGDSEAKHLTYPTDDDDIPLRHLQNTQWAATRSSKDRPSPLPLKARGPPYAHTRQSGNEQASSATSDDGFIPSISPFPFGTSPFVPSFTSVTATGEDDLDVREDRIARRITEGSFSAAAATELPEQEVDHGFEEDTERLLKHDGGRGSQHGLFAKNNTGGPRWCRKCDGWKPDRCHHCRYCRRCVLKSEWLPITIFWRSFYTPQSAH